MDPSRHVNPYIAGSPVTGTEMFFGREDVFSFVRRNLTGRHRDTPIVLYGQRRTGKTSVLYQMHRHLDPRYRCIFIDLHGLSLNGVENLLWGIANSIRRGLQRDHRLSVAAPDRATFSANPKEAFETTFLDAVWSVLGEDHLVLMIDEVVRLHEEVRAGRLEREVFDYLRHLMQHFDRLNFVFSLGSGVEELKMDYAFLFGVALYHRISFLEPVAARALIREPVQGCYQVMPDAVDKILQITSGHPYYTQLVCHCLFDRWLRVPKRQMTSADVEAVLAEAIELGSANLTYVWEDSTPAEQAVIAGMAAAMLTRGCPVAVDQIREVWRKVEVSLPVGEAAAAVRNLTAREVVAASDGAYSFAVDLQRLWLDKHRRLDWVKEELGKAALQWDRPAKAETSAGGVDSVEEELGQAAGEWDWSAKAETSDGGKPPDRQLPRPSAWAAIFAMFGVGILALSVWVIVVFTGNSYSPSGSAGRASSSGAASSPVTPTSSASPVTPASSAGAADQVQTFDLGQPDFISHGRVRITVTHVLVTTKSFDGRYPPKYGYFVEATVTFRTFTGGFFARPDSFTAIVNGRRFYNGGGNSGFVYNIKPGTPQSIYPYIAPYGTHLREGESKTFVLLFDLPSKHGIIAYNRNGTVVLPDGSFSSGPVPFAEWNY